MASRAVQIVFFGVVVIALMQGISCFKCWSGVGDARLDIDCGNSVTKCAKYGSGSIKTHACGACLTNMVECTDCATESCNSAKAVSSSSVLLTLVLSISTWLLARMAS